MTLLTINRQLMRQPGSVAGSAFTVSNFYVANPTSVIFPSSLFDDLNDSFRWYNRTTRK